MQTATVALAISFLCIAVTSAPLRSQTATGEKLSFEVSSIKPNASRGPLAGGCHGINLTSKDPNAPNVPLGRCVIRAARLGHIIDIAYSLMPSGQQLIGGPSWVALGNERFDIEAEAEKPEIVTQQQLLSMLQVLLADRFKLVVHTETREVPGYALMVDPRGIKIHPTKDNTAVLSFRGINQEVDPANENTLVAKAVPMSQLARLLSTIGNIEGPTERGRQPDPVVDQTELKGVYDFKLTWGPDESLDHALQSQLGLRIEPRRVPLQVIVIDHAEKPTMN